MGHKVKQSLVNSRIDFFYYAFRNILLASIPLLIISALTLSLLHSSATNSANDNLSLSIPISCSLSATVATGEEHTISMVAGTYEDEIGKTTINTTCNDPNGYVVYAIGNTRNSEGSNVLYPSTISDTYSIPTGINTSGDTSQWAMKLTAINSGAYTPTIDNGYTSYSLVPNSLLKVAHKDPGTTDVTKNSAFTTTYAIYLEGSQPAGNYSGQVKYVMLHPSAAAHPTTTLESAFALADKEKTTVTDPVTGDSGQFYKMQDMNSSICDSTTLTDENNSIRLVDTRDSKLYWVTKLKDGHCWMTQNLDLDLGVKDTTLGIDTTILTSNDTDLNDGSLSGVYNKNYSYDATNNIISWSPQNITRDYQHSTGTGWSGSNNVAYSLDPGEWYWDGDDSGATACNYLTTTCEYFSRTQAEANRHLSVGNYYNWSAAIASDDSSSLTSSTYGSASDSDSTNRNPKNSICPKGWRLPTISYKGNVANSTSEFARVNGLYNGGIANNDRNLIESPLWFVRAGYSNVSLSGPGSRAFYWSSTASGISHAYDLYFTATSINPASNGTGNSYGAKSLGMSLRCLAR